MRDSYEAPALVDISITNRCNLSCEYCYASASPDVEINDELTLSDFKKLFFELDKMNVHRISLSGGEPFIREDFFDILFEAQKYDFAIVINTNGSFITDYFAKKLKKYRFDRVCITLDGSSSKNHDRFRGDGDFKRVVNAIKILKEYNLPVSTLFTLSENNIDDLINTIKFNESIGIEYLSVMVVCSTGRASNGQFILSKDKWYPVFMKLTDMKLKNEINLNFKIIPPNESNIFWMFYFPLKYYNKLNLLYLWNQSLEQNSSNKREISCQAGIKSCSVNYNGDIYGCDLMIGINEFKAGNIKNESIVNIWKHSKIFNKLREIEVKNLNGKCAECDLNWCGGGCRSSAYNLTNDLYGSDNSCFFEECEQIERN
ncbi:MAG: radical SAM protein [Senegalia sp. (in: firmicutes)]|uniref:radical SAM protein n=1 Tax=Senegalia sp. (in: firmicutes) TaxID=1924098 RepID=UPI003F9CD678